MKNILKTCGFILLVAAIVGILYLVRYNANKIITIELDQISEKVKIDNYVMVYFGDENENITKLLKKYKKEYVIKSYYAPTDLKKLNSYLEQYKVKAVRNDVFALFIDGEFTSIINTRKDEKIRELIRKYLYGEIPESERNYKVLTTAEEYIKKVNSKDYTIAVFGSESCSYCTLYLPVINNIAGDYNLDIYYFDSDNYNQDEYEEILDLDLEIPGECTLDGHDTSFVMGFPKPMTIITKSGKLVGCIRGYVVEDVVIDKLKEFKLIKEK